MSTTNQYLIFVIHLSDLALVTTLQGGTIAADPEHGIAGNGVGAILASPDAAAAKYAAPLLVGHEPFVAPCITSSWFGGKDQFPVNLASFERKSGGWFGISWLFGDKTIYHWRGIFAYAPPADVPGGPPILPPITPRSFIDGFEFAAGEGGTGSPQVVSREGSRHTEGFGLALRGQSTATRLHLYTENGAAPTKFAWDRFYVRLRTLPAASTTFWRIRETTQANVGAALDILPSGQIAVSYVNGASAYALLGTLPALLPDVWTRIDVLAELKWNIPAGTNQNGLSLSICLNGVAALSATQANTGSTGPNTDRWASAEMGTPNANTLGLDIDDWHGCSAFPGDHSSEWVNGSGIFEIAPTALDGATTPAAWTGDVRALAQNPTDDGNALVTSSTASAALVVNTNALDVCAAIPDTLGAVAIAVVLKATTVQTGATLGLSTADAAFNAPLTGAVTQIAAGMHFLWTIVSTRGAKPTLPVNLVFNHGPAGLTTIKSLMACAEVMGAFGPEDTKLLSPAPKVMPTHFGIHNSPYPSTPWARQTTTPIQPVMLRAGTYTGNGTGQDLKFPVPIHFLWVRPLTAPSGGTRWFSSMIGPKVAMQRKSVVDHMVQALIDTAFVGGDETYDGFPAPLPAPPATIAEAVALSNRLAYGYAHNDAGYAGWATYLADPVYFFGRMLGNGAGGGDIPPYGLYATVPSRWNTAQQQTLLRITGDDPQSNQAGIVYSYFAFGDPGMRFLLNGCLKNSNAAATTVLVHPGFTPLSGFFWQEQPGSATSGAFYKGTGHAPSSLSPLDAAELTNSLSFATASIVTQAGFAAAVTDIAFALFRMDDLSGNAGKSVQIGKWTGDGSASRSVALTPASGKRPLWAMVVPHNGTALYRDPQNTTNLSQQVSADAPTATGITGGDIDLITVGATLNANGVVYEYLVFPGSDEAGNGGFSVPGEFFPVPPDAPPGAPGGLDDPQEAPDAPVSDPIEGGGGGEGPLADPVAPTGPMPSLTDDLAAACEPATRRLINVALGRIGITKQIPDIALTQSQEAVSIRLVYNDAIQETLRDFPWPFATRYAQLAVLNGGARPNSDWRYAYRQPSDCLFERRLVVARTDVANPEASPFQLSSDYDPGDATADPPIDPSGGGLIFANLPNAVLEYTARPKCPHTRSEPLFRDAAAWKLAGALAPGLSRLTDAAVLCAKAYQTAIDQAYLVLRPGNAGDVPATPTIDVSALAQAANLQVANLALVQIGAKTIRNLTTDQSREAQLVRIVFEQELRATLRDYPWPFATVYATPALVGGTSTVPVNGDWQYSYRLPADLVFARRLVTPRRRAYEPNPSTFTLAKDVTGSLLYTDVESTTQTPLALEYTTRPEGCVVVSDALFRDALAWRLSWKLAPSLALLVPDRPEAVGRGPDETANQTKERTATGTSLRTRAADKARECYYFALATAKLGAAREAQIDVDPVDATWITERE